MVEELQLSGEIKADEYVKLNFIASGRLAWVGIKEGETVKKGQTLAYLDLTELRTAVIAAENAYLAADAAAKKAEDDVKGHAADETFAQKNTRVSAQTTRDTAYFKLQAARVVLQNASLTAPFAGIVTQVVHPGPGVNITAGTTEIELLNPNTVYFSVTADQTEVGRLRSEMPVKLVLDSVDDVEFTGRITAISLTPDTEATGTVYRVRVNFDQSSYALHIGMTGDVSMIVARVENALFVPPQYIHSNAQGKYLQVGRKQEERVPVEVGIEGEDRTEVEGAISEGQVIYD